MRGLLLLSSLVQIERYLKSQIATTRQGVQTPVELRMSIIFFFYDSRVVFVNGKVHY